MVSLRVASIKYNTAFLSNFVSYILWNRLVYGSTVIAVQFYADDSASLFYALDILFLSQEAVGTAPTSTITKA